MHMYTVKIKTNLDQGKFAGIFFTYFVDNVFIELFLIQNKELIFIIQLNWNIFFPVKIWRYIF